MKFNLQLVTFLTSIVLMQHAMAECPKNLTAEQMQDCIVTEDSGYYYSPRGKINATDEQTNEPVTANEDDSSDSKNEVAATRDNTAK